MVGAEALQSQTCDGCRNIDAYEYRVLVGESRSGCGVGHNFIGVECTGGCIETVGIARVASGGLVCH